MANIVGPKGLSPVRCLNGAPWTGSPNMYYIASTDTNEMGPGDAVKSAAGAAAADANGVPGITKALGTDIMRGVIVGFLVATPNNPSLTGVNLDLTVQNIPAVKTKAYYALVIDDPQVVFEVQDDGAVALSASSVGLNANLTVANPTSPQQNSASSLATASVAVTATLPLKILGLSQKPNTAFGVYATWLVKINQHELQGGTAGV